MKLWKRKQRYYDASECEHLRIEGEPCKECDANRRQGAKGIVAMFILHVIVVSFVVIAVLFNK